MSEVTLRDIAEAIENNDNVIMDRGQWSDLIIKISWQNLGYIRPDFSHLCVNLFGRPVIVCGDEYIVFTKCKYCGSTDGKLDKRNCCGHCGGPIE